MNPITLADKIEGLVIAATDKLNRAIIVAQENLYDDLVLLLKKLELDREGFILQNTANRRILIEAQMQFDEVINSVLYKSYIENYLKTIPAIDALNTAYFERISSEFTPNRNFIKSLQKQAVESVNTLALQEGVISQVKTPLNNILNANINSGGSYSGFLEQLRVFIKGQQSQGQLLKYTNTWTKDTLMNYSRSFQQSATADLKLEWYLFSGPVVTGGKGSEGSRGWCLEKKGRYFHESEIKNWANEEWPGKKPGTTESSIFIFVGGWNCVDSLIPVHNSIVPEEDLQRI